MNGWNQTGSLVIAFLYTVVISPPSISTHIYGILMASHIMYQWYLTWSWCQTKALHFSVLLAETDSMKNTVYVECGIVWLFVLQSILNPSMPSSTPQKEVYKSCHKPQNVTKTDTCVKSPNKSLISLVLLLCFYRTNYKLQTSDFSQMSKVLYTFPSVLQGGILVNILKVK